VPYLVDLFPIELAVLSVQKSAPSVPITLYGPSICLTDPVILQPIGEASSNYGDEEWAQLLPEVAGNRVIAQNYPIESDQEGGEPVYGSQLLDAGSYDPVAGWLDSAVLGWIYSYAEFADDYSWGGWYYHPWRGSIYIVDAGIERIPQENSESGLVCPDHLVNSYFFWSGEQGGWFYLSAGYPDWVFNFSIKAWELTNPYQIADEAYLGSTEAQAFAQAAADNNRPARVISIDGVAQVVTEDYSLDRINFSLVDGVVVEVTRG
jgi:hypothetical protein